MTYQESSDLMNDVSFRGRIKVAALDIATYYLGEDPSTYAHNSRYKWAQSVFLSPDSVAAQFQPAVVMDTQVQTDGTAITDSALKSAVEGVVNKLI